MKKIYALLLVIVMPFLLKAQGDSLFIRSIYDVALEKGHAYKNLEVLCKQVGARITGSAEAQKQLSGGTTYFLLMFLILFIYKKLMLLIGKEALRKLVGFLLPTRNFIN